jgi:acyl-coenzyme A thioesterase PaaI-like protein
MSQDTTQQPNSAMCFGCGMKNVAGLRIRFFNDGPNACRATVVLEDQHQGYPGIAHGGIVATMLDEAMGRAPMSGNPNRFMFTAKMEIRYRQSVPIQQPVTLSGRLVKDRGRMALAEAEVRLEDGSIAAEASATLMEIPREELAKMDFALVDWKVYP